MESRLTPHRPGMNADHRIKSPSPEKLKPSGFKPIRWLLILGAVGLVFLASLGFRSPKKSTPTDISQTESNLFKAPTLKNFPETDTLSFNGKQFTTVYALDSVLQARTLRYVGQYRPDGAVVAACDLRTGQVRALVERDFSGMRISPRMAFESYYPAASLIKIVTAAAKIEFDGGEETDSLPMLGRGHTLYRFQLKNSQARNVPMVSLKMAFAKSINPAFGMMGLEMDPNCLRKMGSAMGFNRPHLFAQGSSSQFIVPDSGYALAEASCGFTNTTTISPLHALEIARGLGDDGRMIPLVFTSKMVDSEGKEIPLETPTTSPAISKKTLTQMQTLMEATVSMGTARRGFHRNLQRSDWDKLEMGGKTGSLDGPVEGAPDTVSKQGRYEWYIGYARLKGYPNEGIAISVMLINQQILAVHATELASLLIRDWARSRWKILARDSSLAAR